MTDLTHSEAGEKKIITFKVGNQVFAIDILALIEIREWEQPTPMPGASRYVRGVTNLRGVVVPIVDLSDRLQVGRTETHARSCVLVVEIDGTHAGFLVDEVADIVTIQVKDIQSAPDIVLSDPGVVAGLVQISSSAPGLEANRAQPLTAILLCLEALKVTRELPIAA